MVKLLRYLRGSAIICAILAPITMGLEVIMDLLQPTLMANIIDIGVANGDLSYVFNIGLKMIITSIISFVAGI